MMSPLRSRSLNPLLSLLLLGSCCLDPVAQQGSESPPDTASQVALAASNPEASAAARPPLLWLIDQDDYPLVRRRLVLLQRDQSEAHPVLAPLLYCFDAADYQRLQPAGHLLLVNGPVSESRSSPNVGMPLQLLNLKSGELQLVRSQSQSFVASPDGSKLLTWNNFQLDLADLEGEDLQHAKPLMQLGKLELGSAQVSQALWMPNSDSFLVQISNYKEDGLKAGVWEYPLQGEPLYLGIIQGRMLCVLGSQTLLHSIPKPRERYGARRLVRSDFHLSSTIPGQFRTEQLHEDLMYTNAVAQRPHSLEFAYARHSDKALVLSGEQAGQVSERILWQSMRSIGDLNWSADGRWLCFTDRNEESQRRIIVIDVETGESQELGKGIRPVFR